MKFSQMPYKRPVYEDLQSQLQILLQQFKDVSTAEACFDVYKAYDDCSSAYITMFNLARIRNALDVNDEFYNKEKEYSDMTIPKLQEINQAFTTALLNSPFRSDMENKWGSLMFNNAEMELKTISSEIVSDLQEENTLVTEYSNLIASSQMDFDGKTLTFAEIISYFENPDRSVRKSAQYAMANWFTSRAEQLDTIFDELVKVRTRIAKKLGYSNFVQLGYDRMQRNCYDQDMVAKFRKGVVEHIVPIVIKLKKEQAQRIGVGTLKAYDQYFKFPDGNVKPKGTADDLLAHGKKMYRELSVETAEFIDFMLDNELFDVLARPGKVFGGYCFTLPKYNAPFILANFNGTASDIAVLNHEAGHAFAAYAAKDIYPSVLKNYSMEIAEVHSMTMEFLTWPWMEGFLGEQTYKYYYTQLLNALTFLPQGAMSDEFQHHIYQNPDMTPVQRNQYWLELEAKYRPWLDLEDTPFDGDGRFWQAEMLIYEVPFYMIDYALAEIVALNFWIENQKSPQQTWYKYKQLVSFAGTKTFLALIDEVDLPTPFEPDNIKKVAAAASAWLNECKCGSEILRKRRAT